MKRDSYFLWEVPIFLKVYKAVQKAVPKEMRRILDDEITAVAFKEYDKMRPRILKEPELR